MAAPIALSHLASALDCGPREHIALVGGGGKSTILHALGHQLTGRVVLTTTTRMGSDQSGSFPVVMADEDPVGASADGPVLAWKRVDADKAHGVDSTVCDDWFESLDYLVVEADGARNRPFKAPSTLEPVIPATTTLVISVIGADALGRVIADQCHRPLRVAALAGCSPYKRLTPERAAAVLLHPRGARRACPQNARLVIAITKVDQRNRTLVDELAELLLIEEPELAAVTIATRPSDVEQSRSNDRSSSV